MSKVKITNLTEVNASNIQHQFLSGGGEMGQLIRDKDWSITPLGDLAKWPQSLRTMVSVMLDTPFGMYIAWGKEYTQLYNNGYRPILGSSKHPQALGISAPETFAEVWPVIEPMFDGVMKGVPVGFSDFMLPLDRNGFVENCYFDFAYSPIRKEDGEVGGVLVTVIETTSRKKSADDLKESRDLFRTIDEGSDIFIMVGDETGTITYFNNAWVQLTGRPVEDLLKLGWLNLVHPDDKDQFLTIYQNAFEESIPFKTELRVLNNKGEYCWLLAQGHPRFRPDGSFAGYISSSVDITETKKIENELKESNEQLRFAVEAAELATFDYHPFTKKFSGNSRLEEWFGLTSQKKYDLSAALDSIDEKDRLRVIESIQKALKYSSGGNFNIFYTVVHPVSKRETFVHAKGRAFFNDDQIAYRLNGALEDVTEETLLRKKKEHSEQIIRDLVEQSPVGICVINAKTMIGELVNQRFLKISGKSIDQFIGQHYWECFSEEKSQYESDLQEVIENGETRYAEEVEVKAFIDGKEEKSFATFVFAPIKNDSGEVTKVAIRKVDTTMQVLARKKIAESEQRFRNSVQQAPLGIAIFRGTNFIVEQANDNYLLIIDRKAEDFIGHPIFEALPELRVPVEDIFKEIVKTGVPFYGNEFPVTSNRHTKLETAYFNFVYHPLRDENGATTGIMVVATEVTEIVKAKSLLIESEKQFREMVMQSPIPMTILKGKDHIIDSANKVMLEDVWRKPEDEVLGISIIDAFPELREQKYPQLLNDVFTTGKTHSEKESITFIEGVGGMKKFYLDFEYAPLFQANKKVWGIRITLNDVTDMVEARKKVEEAEERLRLATELTGIATWDLDLKTGHIIHSSSLAVIFGYPPSKILSHAQLRSQLNPDDRLNIVEKAFKKALETGNYEFEARLMTEDQITKWIRIQGKVFFDENKEPAKIIGTLRDITNEKMSQQVLEESESRFRLLADSLPQQIWTADPNGNFYYFNQTVFDFSGLTLDQLVSNDGLQIIHPDDRESNLKAWMQSVSTGKDFLFEHRFRRYDGDYRWQLSRAIPLKDANGNIQMWVGSSTDIQDIKEQEQQKDLFISMASHELKTPLTSIKGYVQLLQAMKTKVEDSFLKSSLKIIDKQINTLIKLISELLDVSKIKSGGLDFNKENFELTELINEVVTQIRHINPDYDIPVHNEEKIIIYADRNRIGQVLINFLTNAVKYSPQSKTIKVNSSLQNNLAVISVEDFGIGISKQNQEKIFERFYRVEGRNEKTFPGFGIGLFIVAEIIKRHNGNILLKSEPGKGSVFSIELPVEAGQITIHQPAK